MELKTQVATLAGGCFWCLEAVFEQLEGVLSVVPGYTGGHSDFPTYNQVCGGRTGHAEAIQITFNPDVITFRDLIEVFFAIHDPTTRNRQGADIGTQYRSAIFYHNPGQRAEAESLIKDLETSGTWERAVVTEITPFLSFFPAEEYHRDYYRKNPEEAYCQVIINPKLTKLRQKFASRLKG